MKYIDAEKLKVEIEKLKKEARKNALIARDNNNTPVCAFWAGKEHICTNILSIITPLQQGQSELPGYDKALLEVKNKVDKLYEEASIGLSEYDSGLYNGITETCMRLRGFIKARLVSDEQPEVDLDKLVNEEFASHSRTTEYGLEATYNRAELYQLIKRMALVFNARKEEKYELH